MKKIFKLMILLISAIVLIYYSNLNIFAATDYEYIVFFDYECNYYKGNNVTVVSKANNVSTVTVPNDKGKSGELNVKLIGRDILKKTSLNRDSYLSITDFSIEVNGNHEKYIISLVDEFNNPYGELKGNILEVSDLIDQVYICNIECTGNGTLEGYNILKYVTTITFTITIDTVKPIIEGASTSMSGKYTNKAFTIDATDDISGIDEIYMILPGGSTSIKLSENNEIRNMTNGLYTFFAKDNAGNTSKMYYVYYDNYPPNGYIKEYQSNKIINSYYINVNFYYQSSSSDIFKIEYKTPNNNTWVEYQNTIFDNTYSEGEYSFRSLDKAGNYSEIIKVYYDLNLPIGYIYGSDNEIINSNITKSEYIYYVSEDNIEINQMYYKYNDSSEKIYNPNTRLYDKGKYTFYCIDKAGNKSNEISIILEEEEQINCSDSNHIYNTYYKEPTCTEKGGIYYYCINCGYGYLSDIEPPIGHGFSYDVLEATCDKDGIRIGECEFCGYTKQEIIPKYNHNYDLLETRKTDDTLLYIYKCERCGILFEQQEISKHQDILSFTEKIINENLHYITWFLIISVSIFSLIIGLNLIKAKKNEDQEKVYLLIKNYIVGIVLIFIIILMIPLLIRGIIELI